MTFEDTLREQFRKADASVPGDRIDWSTTITKARRSRMKFTALTAVAAASVLGLGAYALTSLDAEVPLNRPAGGGSVEPVPSTSPAPGDNVEIIRGECSAGDSEVMASDWPIPEIPDPVEEMRTKIIVAAIACDYDELERLALSGNGNFGYSYGAEESPSQFWRDRERDLLRNPETGSIGYLEALVSVLDMPHCKESNDDGTGTDTEVTFYVWPRVQCMARTDSDWNDLKGLYTQKQIDRMRTDDLYYGFRVGILEDGDWEYFIAGD